MVWEGLGSEVTLAAGQYQVTLTVINAPATPAATPIPNNMRTAAEIDRSTDAILLNTSNIIALNGSNTITLTNGNPNAGTNINSNAAEEADAAPQGRPVAYADRLIDTLLYTPNATDLKMRMLTAPDFLAPDGLLSQAGEVFFKVTNLNKTQWLNLTIPRVYGHSPYFVQHLSIPFGCNFDGGSTCTVIALPPGGSSSE